jgi:hypothetical protein
VGELLIHFLLYGLAVYHNAYNFRSSSQRSLRKKFKSWHPLQSLKKKSAQA